MTAQSALAQPLVVNPGAQLQQIPPAPTQPKAIPDIRVERNDARSTPETAGPKFVVNTLGVTGATRFSEAELVAAAGFRPGLELDLAGLRALAERISSFYSRHGYFVAQAYVPAQEIRDGAVTIAVIEGRYGKVDVNNQTNVSDRLVRSVLAGVDVGDVVATAPLERRLLLLSDLPGVSVRSTVAPGQAVGASDLVVALTPERRVTGYVEADNAGNVYTGRYRAGGAVYFNEPLGQGDVASLRLLTAGSGLTYGRAAYQFRLQNLTLGASYAHLDYRFGRQFKALDATGTVDVASLYAAYPLIRTRKTNLNARVGLEARSLEDKIGAIGSVSEKEARAVILGVTGDHRDELWGGGWTTYSVDWSIGDHDITTPLARAEDAVTARTQGGYQKLAFDVARRQTVRGPLSLYGHLRGQLASQNLDSSEKFGLGGAYGVRAYPEGEAYGDQGYILSVEARLGLPAASQRFGGQLQASAFVDLGQVELDRSPWGGADNDRTLSAAGLGLTWSGWRNVVVKVEGAVKLGDEQATSERDRSGRAWFQLSKFF
ncbi:MAG: ShlB/FhaC/HecB family hemolysin secretion/activation protein [Phenylobacterium sp.]|uniref:ShlB/FhaC/HecB family hemolysin secretion/activation protein n=1 Tax=Phenylobacterium sp. TaxID=1871053 RepID=UPI0027325B53|nr:ShlB/FhaC/HecB family hemolysin secretion/activation protein [Phenylobacterium sp.]MDP3174385.1 ShlB/FhaC/HecB family hemolysin secretion/activation protein [Phenylobacterium sp.]